MPVTIFHDPFKTLIEVFEAQHPDKSCEIVFGADVGEDGFGVTTFPDDGSVPQVAISFELE